MALYRKRPVLIEARQWTGENTSEIIDWVLANGGTAQWHEAQEAVEEDEEGRGCEATPEFIAIDTLEGTMFASLQDYIVKGVRREFYPCKPDIFEATNELVEED